MVKLTNEEAERLARLAPGKSYPVRQSGWLDVYDLKELWNYRDLSACRRHAKKLVDEGKLEELMVFDPNRRTSLKVYRMIEAEN